MKNNSRPVRVAVAALSVLLLSSLSGAQDVDVPNNLTMRNSTDAATGNVLKDGVPFLHNFGTNNTFLGLNTGNFTMTGSSNTAAGSSSLLNNTTGGANTAIGSQALSSNTTGINNSAIGRSALLSTPCANDNTAVGFEALHDTFDCLMEFRRSINNTAIGSGALRSNGRGESNTATGFQALFSNVDGTNNTANGAGALYSMRGSNNTAIGFNALANNVGGSGNIAIGANVAARLTGGNNNIYIGSDSPIIESGTIRIGNDDVHTAFVVAAVRNTPVVGLPVGIHPVTGQLGVLTMSSRFKEGVSDTSEGSDALLQRQAIEIAQLKARLERLEELVKSTHP
jgi:trimeric autotransporter adhesin